MSTGIGMIRSISNICGPSTRGKMEGNKWDGRLITCHNKVGSYQFCLIPDINFTSKQIEVGERLPTPFLCPVKSLTHASEHCSYLGRKFHGPLHLESMAAGKPSPYCSGGLLQKINQKKVRSRAAQEQVYNYADSFPQVISWRCS